MSEKTDLFIAFDAILAKREGRGGEGKRGFKDNSWVDLSPYNSGFSCSKVG